MNKKFLIISKILKEVRKNFLKYYPHTVIHKIIVDKLGRKRRILVSPRLNKNLRISEPLKRSEFDPSKYFWNK